MSGDNDDVPPLEDMSHAFKPVPAQPQLPAPAAKSAAASSPKQLSKPDGSAKASFGGMRSGFLAAPASKQKQQKQQEQQQQQQSAAAEDLPYIRKNPEAAAASLRLDDVQRSLREEGGGLADLRDKSWITEDLLSQVEANEFLARSLANPRMSAALEKFQRDPKQAFLEYKDDAEVQRFLKAFSALLGDHFVAMADKQPPPQPQQPLITPAVDPDVAEVLQRPGVREALTDPEVGRWMSLLRADPDGAQRALRVSLDPVFQQRIRLLFENGLLGVAK